MRTNLGTDWHARALGALTNSKTGTGTTAPTATTITLDDATAPGSTSAWNGQLITCGAVFGVIVSNTNATPPVVTVDRWYDPTTPGGAAGTTPAAGRYQILAGMAPAQWMAITTDATAAAATDTTLGTEETTNGLGRAYATYAHTTSAASYTLTKAFTYTGSASKVLAKIGVFNASAGGIMTFESVLNATSTVNASGDVTTVTETVTL